MGAACDCLASASPGTAISGSGRSCDAGPYLNSKVLPDLVSSSPKTLTDASSPSVEQSERLPPGVGISGDCSDASRGCRKSKGHTGYSGGPSAGVSRSAACEGSPDEGGTASARRAASIASRDGSRLRSTWSSRPIADCELEPAIPYWEALVPLAGLYAIFVAIIVLM